MRDRLDRTHPAIEKLIVSTLSEAMMKHALTFEHVRNDLETRIELRYAYNNEPIVRIRADDRTLLTADHFLEGRSTSGLASQPPFGPYRIPRHDRELIDASVEAIACGAAIVIDN